ncbi:hypothetical protein ACFW9F_28855 [Streptomyces sp. NPDC059506]|uniref:hypothetical protein n=1 Tax=Streptomyces sp. NPDC059506 TaxID=3347751 RepID=UPI0036CB3FD7
MGWRNRTNRTGTVHNEVNGNVTGPLIQTGEITGGLTIGAASTTTSGTTISGSTGPVALNGNVYTGSTEERGERVVRGRGTVVIEGDNPGGLHFDYR